MHANSAIKAIHPSQANGCVAFPVSTFVPLITTVPTIPTRRRFPPRWRE